MRAIRGPGSVHDLASSRAILYGVRVATRARDHVSTEELLAVTGSTRDVLYQWVAEKLLSRPWVTTGTDGRQLAAAWTPDTLARVRFILAKQRLGLSMDEIATLVDERWPRR